MKTTILICALSCFTATAIILFNQANTKQNAWQSIFIPPAETTIGTIYLPQGFKRIALPEGSFGEWLRNMRLRKDNTVRLYNGIPKERQDLHYAVLDISTGNKDLQQCADAIMRLRAEYYFAQKDYSKIAFVRGDGKPLSFTTYTLEHAKGYTHDCLLNFMEKVFIQCGTYTVAAMTKPVPLKEILPGDVFVKAGSPGHAMIV